MFVWFFKIKIQIIENPQQALVNCSCHYKKVHFLFYLALCSFSLVNITANISLVALLKPSVVQWHPARIVATGTGCGSGQIENYQTFPFPCQCPLMQ